MKNTNNRKEEKMNPKIISLKHKLGNRIKFLTYISQHSRTTRNKTDIQEAKIALYELQCCEAELIRLNERECCKCGS
jgi:hypothetical protein